MCIRDSHKASKADATIAVIEVPYKEASRFGIMNTDENGRILEFEEKPAQPKSNLASMGIYIFEWKLLRKMLLADIKNPDSNHDFGKDIIPTMLKDQKSLYAYKFKGYWKDVGTIDSLWEANMDLLDAHNELDLNDPSWKIYTEDVATPVSYTHLDVYKRQVHCLHRFAFDFIYDARGKNLKPRYARTGVVLWLYDLPRYEHKSGASASRYANIGQACGVLWPVAHV